MLVFFCFIVGNCLLVKFTSTKVERVMVDVSGWAGGGGLVFKSIWGWAELHDNHGCRVESRRSHY